MCPRRLPPSARAHHQEAVARRLALLSEELAAVRTTPGPDEDDEWPKPPSLHAVPDATHEVPEPSRAVQGASSALAVEPVVVPSLVARSAPSFVSPSEPSPVAPSVPVPGRHAARRRVAFASAVPASLRGPVALGPGQLSVIAVLVAVALAVTCWWVVRSDAEDAGAVRPVGSGDSAGAAPALVAAPSPTGASVGPLAAGAAGAVGASASAAGASVTVDVAGKVRRPGIAVLPSGSRVVDALEAAGGVKPGVDLSGLNLARVLADGEQVLVGAQAPPMAAASGLTGSTPATGGGLVSLNAATTSQLEELPEVGPVTAEAIVAWRDQNGGFTSVDQLLDVEGIGEATLAKIAPHVTL